MEPIDKLNSQGSAPQATELEMLMGETKDAGAPRKTPLFEKDIMASPPARFLLGFFAAMFGILLLVDTFLKGNPTFFTFAILLLFGAAVCFVWNVRKMPMSRSVGLVASLLLALFAVLFGIVTFLIEPPGKVAFFYSNAVIGLLIAAYFFIKTGFPKGRLIKFFNHPIIFVGIPFFVLFLERIGSGYEKYGSFSVGEILFYLFFYGGIVAIAAISQTQRDKKKNQSD